MGEPCLTRAALGKRVGHTDSDWDTRVCTGTNGWQNSSMYNVLSRKAPGSPRSPDSQAPGRLFVLGRVQRVPGRKVSQEPANRVNGGFLGLSGIGHCTYY